MSNWSEEEIICHLVEAIEHAILSGDWEVDGADDPDMVLKIATDYLEDNGWRRDGITGAEWIKD